MKGRLFQKSGILFSCILFCFLIAVNLAVAEPINMPEPDPPFISLDENVSVLSVRRSVKAVPTTEWTYHKSADNQHPDGSEQQLLWLMNRARSNPAQEGLWLADTGNTDVENAIGYFNVDLDVMKAEFAAIAGKPPAAFDVRLYNAAKVHSDDLIARDAQDHNNQFNRVTSAGFSYLSVRGNVYSYAQGSVMGHAGFNIDWGGNDGTGMQTGRGHRMAIMSVDGNYTNTGLAMVRETDPGTGVGPYVITGNFAYANESSADHYNRFLVGTVWEDLNSNGMYDPGEGLAGVTIMPDQGSFYAVTSESGGYAIPVDAGNYTVTFSGGDLSSSVTKTAVIDSVSLLLDLKYSDESSGNTPPGTDGSDGNTPNDTVDDNNDITDNGGGSGGGCFIWGVK